MLAERPNPNSALTNGSTFDMSGGASYSDWHACRKTKSRPACPMLAAGSTFAMPAGAPYSEAGWGCPPCWLACYRCHHIRECNSLLSARPPSCTVQPVLHHSGQPPPAVLKLGCCHNHTGDYGAAWSVHDAHSLIAVQVFESMHA